MLAEREIEPSPLLPPAIPWVEVFGPGGSEYANKYYRARYYDLNRTGFLGDLIPWEDGVYGASKSVFTRSSRACRPNGRGASRGVTKVTPTDLARVIAKTHPREKTWKRRQKRQGQ